MEDCLCLKDLVDLIIKIQKKSDNFDCGLNTCSRPYLGQSGINSCYNTRPVTLYTCPGGLLWTMPYTLNETEANSTVFRLEASDGCCATLRVLAPNPDETSIYPYVSTNSFFTINLNCISAIKCLNDTYISCI